MSKKHVFQDCPHFVKFLLLCEANLMNWDMPPTVEDAVNQQYLDYLQQSQEFSLYTSSEPTPPIEKSACPVESQTSEDIPCSESNSTRN